MNVVFTRRQIPLILPFSRRNCTAHSANQVEDEEAPRVQALRRERFDGTHTGRTPGRCSQGRYTRRHNKVLPALAEAPERERWKEPQSHGTPAKAIQVSGEGGESAMLPGKQGERVLKEAQSWEMKVNLGRKLFLQDIQTSPVKVGIQTW